MMNPGLFWHWRDELSPAAQEREGRGLIESQLKFKGRQLGGLFV